MPEARPVLGIPEVDGDLGPWLPPGWLGLLVGDAGSGTTLVAKQAAHAGDDDVPVLFYTTYERTEDIRSAFSDFGWSIDGVRIVNLAEEYYDRVLKRDLEVSRRRDRGVSFKDLAAAKGASSPRRTYNPASRLLSDLAQLDGSFRLVVDSLDFFLEVMDPGDVMMVVRQIRHRVQTLGGSVWLLLQPSGHERRAIGPLEDLADLVVELRSEPKVDAFEHLLAVRKVRNHPERTSIRIVRMTDRGLSVPPKPEASRTT